MVKIREKVIDFLVTMYHLFDTPVMLVVAVTVFTLIFGSILIYLFYRIYDNTENKFRRFIQSCIMLSITFLTIGAPVVMWYLMSKAVPTYLDNQALVESGREMGYVTGYYEGQDKNAGECRVEVNDNPSTYAVDDEYCHILEEAFYDNTLIMYKRLDNGHGLFQSFDEPKEIYNKLIFYNVVTENENESILDR